MHYYSIFSCAYSSVRPSPHRNGLDPPQGMDPANQPRQCSVSFLCRFSRVVILNRSEHWTNVEPFCG